MLAGIWLGGDGGCPGDTKHACLQGGERATGPSPGPAPAPAACPGPALREAGGLCQAATRGRGREAELGPEGGARAHSMSSAQRLRHLEAKAHPSGGKMKKVQRTPTPAPGGPFGPHRPVGSSSGRRQPGCSPNPSLARSHAVLGARAAVTQTQTRHLAPSRCPERMAPPQPARPPVPSLAPGSGVDTLPVAVLGLGRPARCWCSSSPTPERTSPPRTESSCGPFARGLWTQSVGAATTPAGGDDSQAVADPPEGHY